VGKTRRAFAEVDGVRRRRDVAEQLVAVQTADGERQKVYPAKDPRFMRVLRKVIRGLSAHHKLRSPVADEQVWADVQRFAVPSEFLLGMTEAHAEHDVLRYRYGTLPDDDLIHSFWLLEFFGRTPFIGIVFRSVAARAVFEGRSMGERAS
jgi:hypothetical protein